jgi:hypothetical protein
MCLSIIAIIVLSCLNFVSLYNVKCDKIGACWVQMANADNFYLNVGKMPFIFDKNTVPMKNTTLGPDYLGTIQKTVGYSPQGYLAGSQTYECTGGLEECINGCCKKGLCTDPQNICVTYGNRIRLVYLIIGFIFLLFFIVYWAVFYILGIIYNAKPKINKSDNIYKKSSLKQSNENEKINTPINLGSTEKLEENRNLIGKDNYNTKELVPDQLDYDRIPRHKDSIQAPLNKTPHVEMEVLKNSNQDKLNQQVFPKIQSSENTKIPDQKIGMENQEKKEESKKNFFNWMFN